jgi:MYXO-CTERM domain-containing protein
VGSSDGARSGDAGSGDDAGPDPGANDEGCACTTGEPSRDGGSWLLGLVGLPGHRRRRR